MINGFTISKYNSHFDDYSKSKKSSQMMFKKLTNTYIVYRKTDGLEVTGFAIIIKSILSNVSL